MLKIIKELYVWFYALNLSKAVGLILAVMLLWTALCLLMRNHNNCVWKWVCRLLLVASIFVIASPIILRIHCDRQLILQPLYFLKRAQQNTEAYRSALMNVFLFVPIGLILPNVLPDRWTASKRVVMTVVLAASFSVLIETIQFLFSLGVSETDDVLCNTLGGAIAATHMWMCSMGQRLLSIKE